MTSPPTPRTRPSTGRIVGFSIAAAITAVLALSAFAAGGGLLWANGERDDDGFVSTDTEQLATSGHALTTGRMDLDLDGAGEFLDAIGSGDVKIAADAGGSGTFIGIARTQDVDRYLRDVRRTVVTDYSDWFEPTLDEVAGDRRPVAPGSRSFWVAKTSGRRRAAPHLGRPRRRLDGRGHAPGRVPSRRRGRHRRRELALVPAASPSSRSAIGVLLAAGAALLLVAGLRGPRGAAPTPPSEQATTVMPGEMSPGV